MRLCAPGVRRHLAKGGVIVMWVGCLAGGWAAVSVVPGAAAAYDSQLYGTLTALSRSKGGRALRCAAVSAADTAQRRMAQRGRGAWAPPLPTYTPRGMREGPLRAASRCRRGGRGTQRHGLQGTEATGRSPSRAEALVGSLRVATGTRCVAAAQVTVGAIRSTCAASC